MQRRIQGLTEVFRFGSTAVLCPDARHQESMTPACPVLWEPASSTGLSSKAARPTKFLSLERSKMDAPAELRAIRDASVRPGSTSDQENCAAVASYARFAISSTGSLRSVSERISTPHGP